MVVRLETNWSKVSRQLGTWRRDQYPFAVSNTLTQTARFAADRFRQTLRRKFTIRNQRVEKGIQFRKGDKKRYPKDFSLVGTLDAFLARHEPGGTFKPQGPHRFAVPTARVRRRLTARGKVSRSLTPRRLRETGGYATGEGRASIRKKVRGQGLGVFYWLVRRIRLDPTLEMEKDVRKFASQRFEREFVRQLQRASRSAR